MGVLEFIQVLVAIILGLGMADLLKGCADLLRPGQREVSGLHLGLATWLFLASSCSSGGPALDARGRVLRLRAAGKRRLIGTPPLSAGPISQLSLCLVAVVAARTRREAVQVVGIVLLLIQLMWRAFSLAVHN